MTKPIRSYPEEMRGYIAKRRTDDDHAIHGLGYWAAKDYLQRKMKAVIKAVLKLETPKV